MKLSLKKPNPPINSSSLNLLKRKLASWKANKNFGTKDLPGNACLHTHTYLTYWELTLTGCV